MTKASERELELVKEIRGRIDDLDLSEEYLQPKNLIRFVRARKGNLNDIEDMIRKNASWLESYDIDGILSWTPPPSFKDQFPWSVVGFDNKGGPVVTVLMGRWNPAAVVGYREEFIRQCVKNFETVWTLMKLKSKGRDHIPQFTIIIDMEGLSWKHYTTYEAWQGILGMVAYFDAHYPETLRKGVFVNAPSIFSVIWKMIRSLLSEETQAKLTILGSDKRVWKQTLCEYAKIDQIPQYFGGTLSDSQEISLDGRGSFKYLCQNGNDANLTNSYRL